VEVQIAVIGLATLTSTEVNRSVDLIEFLSSTTGSSKDLAVESSWTYLVFASHPELRGCHTSREFRFFDDDFLLSFVNN
jgi:hypothetical protein